MQLNRRAYYGPRDLVSRPNNMDETILHTHIDANFKVCIMFVARYYYKNDNTSNMSHNQRTNGPVNAHLISWPSKAKNKQNLENIW